MKPRGSSGLSPSSFVFLIKFSGKLLYRGRDTNTFKMASLGHASAKEPQRGGLGLRAKRAYNGLWRRELWFLTRASLPVAYIHICLSTIMLYFSSIVFILLFYIIFIRYVAGRIKKVFTWNRYP